LITNDELDEMIRVEGKDPEEFAQSAKDVIQKVLDTYYSNHKEKEIKE